MARSVGDADPEGRSQSATHVHDRSLRQHHPDGVGKFDRDGRLLATNAAPQRLIHHVLPQPSTARTLLTTLRDAIDSGAPP